MLRKSSGDDVLQIYSTQQSADNITASSDSVETPAESAGKPTTQPTVAKSASPVSTNVAVASFQLQQQLLLNTLFMNHTQVSAIAWHPTEKILALGCRNGSVLLWTNGDDYDLVDLKNYKLTSAPVTALAWNEQTSHLAIADQVCI
jgi:WD40 repeat protein